MCTSLAETRGGQLCRRKGNARHLNSSRDGSGVVQHSTAQHSTVQKTIVRRCSRHLRLSESRRRPGCWERKEDGIGARWWSWWRQDFGNVAGRPVTVLRGLEFDFDGVELVTSVPSPPFFVPPRPPHSPASLNPNIGKSLLTETKSLLISASPSSMSVRPGQARSDHGCASELSFLAKVELSPQGSKRPGGGWTEA
jgi:hypothetical protein